MISVPNGYILIKTDTSIIVCKQSYEVHLLEQGIDRPDVLIRTADQIKNLHKGRADTPSLAIQGSPEERMIIRKYHRGGFFRFINRDLYWGTNRHFTELAVTVEAAEMGIPVPEILAAVSVRAAGPLYCGFLISKELTHACDLPAYITTHAKSRETFQEDKKDLLKKTAETIRLMHDKGFYHGDLNMKNILVDVDNPGNIYIIDWDKSRAKQRVTAAERSTNLIRFCRSMAKFSCAGLPLTEADQLFVLTSYWSDPDRVETDLHALKRTLALRKPLWRLLKR